jgi:dipeptidyl-peptidase-3
VSTYFSADCTDADAAIASRFLQSIHTSAYNTRLFKVKGEAGAAHSYTVLFASAETPAAPAAAVEHLFEGHAFRLQYEDHAHAMAPAVDCLRKASAYAANETQTAMLASYVESFQFGSIDAHKEGSRHWIQDKGPTVESYIGFIESYRDPSGERGEWEGFVACVNKEASKKFQVLVDSAEDLLPLMPWPKEFEKEKFFRPDFTSLDILAFGSSGVPAGINIPNYDDIRQNYGFKNVSLGNVLKAGYGASGDKPVSFVRAADQAIYKELMGEAFEVQVRDVSCIALHC